MRPTSSASDRSLCGDYLNMPRGVLRPTVSAASFPPESPLTCNCGSTKAKSLQLHCARPQKEKQYSGFHPSSQPLHRLLCILWRVLLYSLERRAKPLTSSGPNRLLSTIIRQKPTGKMKQWLSTMKIEWCTFRVQLVCTLVTYVSLVRASAPLSPSSSPGTQTSVLNWW